MRNRKIALLIALLLVIAVCSIAMVFGKDNEVDRENKAMEALLPYRPRLVMRPGVYFGTRTGDDQPILTGIAWFASAPSSLLSSVIHNNINNKMDLPIRHECSEKDGLGRWGWTHFDIRSYGKQVIEDKKLGVKVQTQMFFTTNSMKTNNQAIENGKTTGGWKNKFINNDSFGSRISIAKLSDQDDQIRTISLIFYVSVEQDSRMKLKLFEKNEGTNVPSRIIMITTGKGSEIAKVVFNQSNHVAYAGARTINGPDEAWRVIDPLRKSFIKKDNEYILNGEIPEDSNVVFFQTTFNVTSTTKPHEIDIAYLVDRRDQDPVVEITRDGEPKGSVAAAMAAAAKKEAAAAASASKDTCNAENGDNCVVPESETDKIVVKVKSWVSGKVNSNLEKEFEEKFLDRYKLKSKAVEPHYIDMARSGVSNCFGSHSTFWGASVQRKANSKEVIHGKHGPLFTGVPSRAFFPRGFLWDEGFHQYIVSRLDPEASRTVVSHWLSRMDKEGWIAREQILGTEATERVPEKFRIQDETFANPPTLLIAFASLMTGYDSLTLPEDKEKIGFLRNTDATPDYLFLQQQNWEFFFRFGYKLFIRQLKWTLNTQKSPVKIEGRGSLYAWKGRSADGIHTLTSGIDDYPRGRVFNPNGEAHVDLLAWIIWEAKILAGIAAKLKIVEDEITWLNDIATTHTEALLKYHWNNETKFFNDIGVIDNNYPFPSKLPHPRTMEEARKRSIEEGVRFGLVPHVGYIGLIPFLLEIVPADATDKLSAILDRMEDPDELFSIAGLRSLSKKDYHFGKDENYWRGASWININYLALRSLKFYSTTTKDGNIKTRAQVLEKKLRKVLVENIYKVYNNQGHLYESYDSITGKGKGTHPFTGWTALIPFIISE